ncbi:hypothetical protein LGL55_05820 [Clostridium tagluense]|uniref:hypothetical protein n=1 Tax=Clostridium tagluense TaxID=360422 RepID=UPI001CF0FDFC|nr:hypothetical protein [Clostridium tagluense]MCB2310639.1 hypothetical protein [Clostridium tagluense]MCB2315630.1 hypothetical protein [Clostridium tagluense]MCB2320484.1 hypothetical protein [Clostridium tagluense]MCB2325233.1 hypothetical protein [Clostridium tagluense]MCB2330085.1 hypothetical protein [Clostridium tagluense]
MSGEVYIADKATLDLVKKGMTPFSKLLYQPLSTNSNITIFSLSGSGQLDKALAITNSNVTWCFFKVIADGVMVFQSSTKSLPSGLAHESCFEMSESGYYAKVLSPNGIQSYIDITTMRSYPYLNPEAGALGGVCILSRPIPFTSSLQIILETYINNTATGAYVSVQGGTY